MSEAETTKIDEALLTRCTLCGGATSAGECGVRIIGKDDEKEDFMIVRCYACQLKTWHDDGGDC